MCDLAFPGRLVVSGRQRMSTEASGVTYLQQSVLFRPQQLSLVSGRPLASSRALITFRMHFSSISRKMTPQLGWKPAAAQHLAAAASSAAGGRCAAGTSNGAKRSKKTKDKCLEGILSQSGSVLWSPEHQSSRTAASAQQLVVVGGS
jgi:hypothetical protein